MFAVANVGGADVHKKPESKSETGSGAEFSKPETEADRVF